MRINPLPNTEPNEKYFGPRKKKLDVAARIDTAVKEAFDELETHPDRRAAFVRLLARVRTQSGLLKPTLGKGSVGWFTPVFLINRLKNLASRQKFWLKPVETWCSQGGSIGEEFRSLARHLFAIYAVPGFMDAAWELPAVGRKRFNNRRRSFNSDAAQSCVRSSIFFVRTTGRLRRNAGTGWRPPAGV